MLSFECDYLEGCHEKILQRFLETNMQQLPGYGEDLYSESAKAKIRAACAREQAEVFLLTGGTQTNAIIIDTMLRSCEGVIAASTGHVSVHEAGAIEHTGHKVLQIGQKEGKIQADELESYLENFWQDPNRAHMVFPGMVYISHPTEYGTLYSKKELERLSQICRRYKIPLYLDGARLACGLMSRQTDVTLPDVAEYCDVFYIGATKAGALCGEAVVFPQGDMPPHFMTMVKQRGALLAKGRLLGIQFDTLFTDNLYFELGRHAIDMAQLLKDGLARMGYSFYLDSPTNQQFVVLENRQMKKLSEKVRFEVWEKADEEHTVVRFATSWATREEDIRRLLDCLR